MKAMKILMSVAVIGFLSTCDKVNREVDTATIPGKVKSTFETENPDAENVKWEIEGDYYVVEFQENGFEKEVVYDVNGLQMTSETEIAIETLIPAIKNYISRNYTDFSIEEAEREENKKGIFYEVEIKRGDDEIELIFDSTGNFVKQEIEDEEDDEYEEENEREISIDALPKVIKDAIVANYQGAELLDADEVTQTGGMITYDVEIKTGGNIIELMYDAQGNFLGMESDDDDDDE